MGCRRLVCRLKFVFYDKGADARRSGIGICKGSHHVQSSLSRSLFCAQLSLPAGGELLASVLQRGSYSEETARECFRQLLEGVKYCHSLGVVHRDLKLENLLLEEEHDLSRIRIVDFGLAKGHFHKRAMSMDTVCGTPHYVAPEVIVVRPRSSRCSESSS